jgi:hypothetical protein
MCERSEPGRALGVRAGIARRAALLVCVALSGSAVSACAARPEIEAYRAQLVRATEEYREARERCRALTAAEQRLCGIEARAALAREQASARAGFKNTPRAHMQARVAAAEADYRVEVARCAAADAPDMCRTQARVALARATEQAKLDYAYAQYPDLRRGADPVDAATAPSTGSSRFLGTHECAALLDLEERYLCIRNAEEAGRM